MDKNTGTIQPDDPRSRGDRAEARAERMVVP